MTAGGPARVRLHPKAWRQTEVLALVHASTHGLTVGDVADACDITPKVASDVLGRLVKRGALVRAGARGRYRVPSIDAVETATIQDLRQQLEAERRAHARTMEVLRHALARLAEVS